jgi:hypothetical protein
MKAQGHPPPLADAPRAPRAARLPRVVVTPARAGHVHAASEADLERLLRRLGARFFYGLASIELTRGDDGPLAFGRYVAPGRVLLFDVPVPPWRGALHPDDAARLARAGAVVSRDLVEWPGDSLRAFFLSHVLLHELGHHLLQHHHGKRPSRIARTGAHEAFAELAAARARRLLGAPP